MTLNLNDEIEVTLTEEGVNIYKNYLNNLKTTLRYYPGLKENKLAIVVWEFAHVFGSELWHGNPTPPCEMNIKLTRSV